jgi:hypothetical protein
MFPLNESILEPGACVPEEAGAGALAQALNIREKAMIVEKNMKLNLRINHLLG